ncbi:hypothetical protein EsH8_IX_000701 [Colletotrichum jinshuiense]
MGEFGNTVDSLLETYSKCLSLLKSLKGVNNNDKQPRQLRKSIRSDRSKVRSVYSTRLSVSGSHLEKGDAAAQSSLKKVINRLTSAMTRLLRLITRGQNPIIDYQSLKTLSNSSRVDAVKTINDLSRRLSTSSARSSSSASSKKERRQKRSNLPRKPQESKSDRTYSQQASREGEEQEHRNALSVTAAVPVRARQIDANKRVSMATVSSGSTKLGEIAPKKLYRRQSMASDEFAVQPTYPLRPYYHDRHHSEIKRKRFWNLFGRG